MRRPMIVISSLALIFSGLSINPVHANGGGTTVACKVNGVDSGSFTVDNNVVTTNTSCAGVAAIPSGVTSISANAFKDATGLISVLIPSTVSTFGDSAFENTYALTSVEFLAGSTLTNIGTLAFAGAASLSSISIPSGVTRLRAETFRGALALSSVTIPEGVTHIDESAFLGASTLNSITFPTTIQEIGQSAFFTATSLTDIRFTEPSQLTQIGASAFASNTSLQSITIPASVTDIGNNAFEEAILLSEVYFLGDAPSVGFATFIAIGSNATAYIKSGAIGFPAEGETWENQLLVSVGVYTARYNSIGGTEVSSGNFIRNGSIASEPTAPTRSGHTFDGWSAVDGGDIITFPYSPGVNRDITLFAKWTADAVPKTDSNPVASAPAAVTKIAKSVSNTIRFSTSAKILTKAHKAKLKKSVKASGLDATYVVTGTAGMLPGSTKAQVRKLAKLRANAIKAYLVKLGVNKANISIEIKITNQGIVPKTKTLAKYLVS